MPARRPARPGEGEGGGPEGGPDGEGALVRELRAGLAPGAGAPGARAAAEAVEALARAPGRPERCPWVPQRAGR